MSVSDTCVNIEKYDEIKEELYFKRLGKIAGVVGLTIESVGPDARLGDLCRIYKSGRCGDYISAEVVGFKDGLTLLMPYEVTDGIGGGCIVENRRLPADGACRTFFTGENTGWPWQTSGWQFPTGNGVSGRSTAA